MLVTVNLLVKPFWVFGIDRNIQLSVGEGAYGIYFALFNLSLVLNILLDVGITNFNNRNIAQHSFLVRKHFSNLVVIKFMLAVGYAVITLILALVIGYRGYHLFLLLMLIVNQFLNSFILYLRSNISALLMFKTDSLLSVTDRIIMIGICSLLLWGNYTDTPFRIEWFIFSQTLAYLLTALIALFVLIYRIGRTSVNFDLTFALVILKKSFPYALLILLMSVYNRMDSVFLERLLPNGSEHAGFYAQGFRILDAFTMFAYLLAGLLLPIFSFMLKKNEDVTQIVKLASAFLLVPSFIGAVGCSIFRHDIINVLYHHRDDYSADTFGILILGYLPISITYIYGTLLTANGSLRMLNTMALAAVILNVVLNIILIPRYSALGAALSSLTTQTFAAGTQFFISKRIFKIIIPRKVLLKIVVFIGSTFGIGYLVSLFGFSWIFELLTFGILSLLLANILELFSVKALIKIIRYNE